MTEFSFFLTIAVYILYANDDNIQRFNVFVNLEKSSDERKIDF